MRIRWAVDTYATVEIDGTPTALLIGEEYIVPDDSQYFQDAITRGWAEVLTELPPPTPTSTRTSKKTISEGS